MPDHMLPWENENSIDTVRGSVESTLHRLCTANLEDVHSENVYAAIRGSLNWLLEPVVRDWYSRRLWPDERASFSLLVTHTMVTALQVVRSDGPYIGLSFLVRRIHVPSQDPKILTLTPASASSEPLLGRGLDDGKPSFISSRFHGLTPLLTFYPLQQRHPVTNPYLGAHPFPGSRSDPTPYEDLPPSFHRFEHNPATRAFLDHRPHDTVAHAFGLRGAVRYGKMARYW